MKITGLGIIVNLVKEGLKFFTTKESKKRQERKDAMKFIIQVMRDNKKERSVAGWVGLFVILGFILFDIVKTGGSNFDVLLTIYGAWSGV
ncbi:hypothetical protein PVS_01 [Vibrio phage vB_VspS_VS-ABTNL-3]|nr:hypothetical protein PVS_01 [Vibrio phage vB_VspS_VS-ABTNL-3]